MDIPQDQLTNSVNLVIKPIAAKANVFLDPNYTKLFLEKHLYSSISQMITCGIISFLVSIIFIRLYKKVEKADNELFTALYTVCFLIFGISIICLISGFADYYKISNAPQLYLVDRIKEAN